MAPSEDDCLELGPAREVLEHDVDPPNLLITGRATNLNDNSEFPAELQKHIEWYEARFLVPERMHTVLLDLRQYPCLPPAGVVQQAISWLLSKKEEMDKLQVAMAVVLADSFWSAGARAVINLVTKAVPPASPFLICHTPEKAREFFQAVASTRSDLVKAGGSAAELSEELPRRCERFVTAASLGALSRRGSFISARDLELAEASDDGATEIRTSGNGDTRVVQMRESASAGSDLSMARSRSGSVRGRARTRFLSCREALADGDDATGMRHLASRGNVFFAVDELLEEEEAELEQDASPKDGRSSTCCGTARGSCSIL